MTSSTTKDKTMLHKEQKERLYPDLDQSVYEHFILMDGLDITKSQSIMREVLTFLEKKDCSNTLKLAILTAMSQHLLYAIECTENAVNASNNSPEFKSTFMQESQEFKNIHKVLLENFDKEIKFYKERKYTS